MPTVPEISRDSPEADRPSSPKISLQELALHSNTGSIDAKDLGWIPVFSASTPDEVLRQELEEKGIVHIRDVMPREFVMDMRQRWFESVAPSGIMKEGTSPRDGIFCGGNADDFVGPDNGHYIGRTKEDCEHLKLALDAWQSDFMHEFCSNSHLLGMVQRLQPENQEPFVYRREMIRTNVPNCNGTSTGVHYDQIFLRACPDASALTGWVPIGDVAPDGGGLMYLEDSKGLGEEMERDFWKMAKEQGLSQEQKESAFNQNMMGGGMLSTDAGAFGREKGGGRRWLVGDYKAGDVVFHHAYMIHASNSNRDQLGRIRISADLRFGDKKGTYDPRWQQMYLEGDGL